jgi:hypothetical protein
MNSSNSDSANNVLSTTEVVLGQSIADITVTLIAIVTLLRKQPGFDNQKFLEDVQALLNNATEASDYTKTVLSLLVNNQETEDNS